MYFRAKKDPRLSHNEISEVIVKEGFLDVAVKIWDGYHDASSDNVEKKRDEDERMVDAEIEEALAALEKSRKKRRILIYKLVSTIHT